MEFQDEDHMYNRCGARWRLHLRDRNRSGIEITVTYAFPDGRDVKVKGSSFVDLAGDRITGWRVYVDVSRLS